MKEIELSFRPNIRSTSKTKGALTVRQGDKVLDVATLDIAGKAKRNQYIDGLIEQYPGLDTAEIRGQLQKQMIEIAAGLIVQSDEDAEKQDGEENQPLVRSKAFLKETEPELVELAEQFLHSPDLLAHVRHLRGCYRG